MDIRWEGERVSGLDMVDTGSLPLDEHTLYEYGEGGRLARKRWWGLGPTPFDVTTTYAWTGERLASVERHVTSSGEAIERWDFSWGCAASDLDIRIAPMHDWQRELETIPFLYDTTELWGFPEAL
jgi:hypothetical protein